MRRRIAIAAGALVAALLLGSGLLAWFLVYTEAGLRFVAERVPARIGRLSIALGEVSGTLAGGVRIARVELGHEIVHIVAEDIEAELELLPLAWQTISLREGRVRNLLVEAKHRKTPVPKRSPRFLPPFLAIAIDEARIAAWTLVATNGQRFDFEEVSSSASVRHRSIRFFDTALRLEGLRATASGELRAADPMQIEGDLRATWSAEGQPQWVAAAALDGDLARLSVEGEITEPLRASISGEARELVGKLAWGGKAIVHDFSLEPWGNAGPLGRITGELALEGDARIYEARGPLTPEGLGVGVFDSRFVLSYSKRTVDARAIELVHRGSKARLEARGTIEVVSDGPLLDLEGGWTRFLWPLANGAPAFRSPSGRFSLAGTWPFDVSLAGELVLPELPAELSPMAFTAKGQLARDRFDVESGTLGLLGGTATLAGEAIWSPQDRWRIAGRARDVDPARWRPDLPGRLAFDVEASGVEFGAEGTLDVAVRNLRGQLRGSPASGSGRFRRTARETWIFDGVRARLGRTTLGLDGRLAAMRDLRFTIDAQDLSLLAPESRGQLRASGRLAGNEARPIVTLAASGKGLKHGELALEALDADVDLDGRGEQPSRATVTARGLRYGERAVDELAFTLDGTAGDHALALEARSGALRAGTRGKGAFVEGQWTAELAQLTLADGKQLSLALQAPARVHVSREELRLEPLCLLGRTARFCGEGQSRDGIWRAALSADDMPMSALTAGLTPAVTYEGVLDVKAQAFGAADRRWEGELRADLTQAQLSHRRRSGRIDLITLGTGSIDARATPESFSASVALDARETGQIAGELLARREGEEWREFPARGSLRMRTDQLGFVSLYFPDIDRAAGRLETDLVVGGTLGTPLVSGVLRLENAEVDLYQVNLMLRGASLEARFIDNGLTLSGGARAGDGSLKVAGKLAWRDGVPFGDINVSGERLRVVDVPEATIEASPNLDFKVQGRRIDVAGGIRIPFARIEPADLAGAVLPSGDEVIVGSEPVDPSRRFEVGSFVMMTLGDRVTIETAGLSGSISGSIAVKTEPDAPSLGTGELNVVAGQYTALARRLDIQRGRLIFGGGLLTNPGVDIRAAKEFPDVVAGVNVRGTLQQPRLTFFSEPSLPQSQIVSLLIAGGSLESAQNSTREGSTRNALVAQGGAILAAELGSRIGLDDVSVESTLDNDTALVLGRYLSPRLYISYGISLTESINTFKARYTLGDRWTLRTEAGREQSAELVYTIEK